MCANNSIHEYEWINNIGSMQRSSVFWLFQMYFLRSSDVSKSAAAKGLIADDKIKN